MVLLLGLGMFMQTQPIVLCFLLFGCQSNKSISDTSDSIASNQWADCGGFADTPFLLSPSESSTQIHPDVVFSDGQFWISYNLPNSFGKFEVWLQALDCEGSQTFGPELVSVDAEVNHTVPRLAVSGDTVMLLWQSDDASGSQNLSIRYRTLDVTTEVFSERLFWSPFPEGTSDILNAWMPAIDSFDGGFWVAGAVAYDDTFSIVAQPINASGEFISEPTLLSPAARASYYPSIAAKSDNEFGLIYEAISGSNTVHMGEWSSGSFVEQFSLDNAAAPDVTESGQGYLTAMHVDTSEPTVYLGENELGTGGLTHTPSISLGEDGFLVSHYKIISGFQNSLHWTWHHLDGTLAADGMMIQDPPAAPYKTALTHIGGNGFMAVWSGGQSPDFMLYAKRILPAR